MKGVRTSPIRLLGVFFISLGLLFLVMSISYPNITGNVIIYKTGQYTGSVFGVFLITLGILLFYAGREERDRPNLAQEVLDRRAVITDPRKLKRIARRMGYETRKVKEGLQVLGENNNPLTVIPHGHISSGVYRSIIVALATGESSFRRRV